MNFKSSSTFRRFLRFPVRVRNFVIVRGRLVRRVTQIEKSGLATCYTILERACVRAGDTYRLKLLNGVE